MAEHSRFPGTFLAVQRRGVLTLPPDLRRRHHLDQPGAQVGIIERDDGVIELHSHVPVPADQQWFWSDAWQEGEREVNQHVERGEVTVHDSADAFRAHLESLGSES